MTNMIGNLIKNNMDIDDKLIVASMLSAAKKKQQIYILIQH